MLVVDMKEAWREIARLQDENAALLAALRRMLSEHDTHSALVLLGEDRWPTAARAAREAIKLAEQGR